MSRIFKHIHRQLNCRKIHMKLERAIISFTFDDVYESAALNAGEILGENNIYGTFYVSAGLLGKKGLGGKYASEAQIRTLVDDGHHIACHTFSHKPVHKLKLPELEYEFNQNKIVLQSITDVNDFSHFSYPYGKVSLRAKKILGEKYKTLRGISPGVNKGKVDLNLLRAVPIYDRLYTEQDIEHWISIALKTKGWLIFYTHDVSNVPSYWGTTYNLFKSVVSMAVTLSAEIVNVQEAYKRISKFKP